MCTTEILLKEINKLVYHTFFVHSNHISHPLCPLVSCETNVPWCRTSGVAPKNLRNLLAGVRLTQFSPNPRLAWVTTHPSPLFPQILLCLKIMKTRVSENNDKTPSDEFLSTRQSCGCVGSFLGCTTWICDAVGAAAQIHSLLQHKYSICKFICSRKAPSGAPESKVSRGFAS